MTFWSKGSRHNLLAICGEKQSSKDLAYMNVISLSTFFMCHRVHLFCLLAFFFFILKFIFQTNLTLVLYLKELGGNTGNADQVSKKPNVYANLSLLLQGFCCYL